MSDVIFPLVLANMMNVLEEVLFLMNWKAKRNSTKSLSRYLYQITDLQIMYKMMELMGQILIQFSLRYLEQFFRGYLYI